jgi:hypothetical protein
MRREHRLVLALFGIVDCALALGVVAIALRLASFGPGAPAAGAPPAPLAPPAVAIYTIAPSPSLTPLPPVSAAEVGSGSVFAYTVVNGDSLWGLSVRFKVSIAALMAANPYMNPNQLRLGAVVVIPMPPTATPTGTPTATQPGDTSTAAPSVTVPTLDPTATVVAQVNASGQGLRFRRGPGTAGQVFAYLNAQTPLVIIGRTPDNSWLEVVAPEGQGWVMAKWVDVYIDLTSIPVSDTPIIMATATPPPPPTATRPPFPTATPSLPPNATPTDFPLPPTSPPGVIPTATSAAPTQAPPTFPPPGSYPLISGITEHSHQIFLTGQTLGNRADVFSKVGDSITANDAFLAPIGWGQYNLGQYTYLAPVIAFFSQANARTGNSFDNTSLAAKGGWAAWQVINPGAVIDTTICNPGENPLECEYRVVQPSVSLIMIGTNDVRYTPPAQYEAELRQIIQTSINRGVIPVLSTIPPLHRDWAVGRVEVLNGIIVSLAREYDIPLWDYWSALQGLPNDGLGPDGVHPSLYAGHAADFTPDYIQAGYTVRNMLALQALDAVWQAALH